MTEFIPMRNWIHLVLAAIALIMATAFVWEWRSAHQDSTRLKAQLAVAEQSVQQANANQQQRDKQLTQTLTQLESLKAIVKSQQDILAKLPEVLPLPVPLVAAPQPTTNDIKPDSPQPQPTSLPAEDLKPLYDFAVDCKACQIKLNAATADLADEKNKTQALSRERDAAVKAAKGGSLAKRIKRVAQSGSHSAHWPEPWPPKRIETYRANSPKFGCVLASSSPRKR